MAISDRDRKLLWARSGNVCAFPGCPREIAQDKADGGGAFPVAPEAHIVGRNRNSPRGDYPLPLAERDSYANLILLCPTHHTVIDNDIATYTVENIREMKANHERWVRENLSSKAPPLVSLSKLPSTSPNLFGRDRELALLDQAWEDPKTNLVAFIAFGGVGKSAVVSEWLRRMAKDDYRGAHRVFGWSFYSQGQREHTVSADLFIEAALRFFGDPNPAEGNAWDKGQRLAALINQQPTILALDGVEPLQSTAEEGKINDPALDTLLRELAYGVNGLCLLTSRVAFPDLPLSDVVREPDPPGAAVCALRINLERLSPEAGRHLLRQAGVKGLDDELDTAVEEYEGHALALVLLGEYLAKFLDADIAKRDLIPPFPDRTRAGRHAFRVMDAYDRALAKDIMEAERALLRIIGLFDRPADKGCLDALRRPPAIQGVTDAIMNLNERQWREAVGTLRQLRLFSPPSDPDDGSIDAHPLVREWFGLRLKDESGEGFQQAHGRLYEYLRDTTVSRPDTIGELMPLYNAIRHACAAGRHYESLKSVFLPRITRGTQYHSAHRLGAHAANLNALADLFEEKWQTVLPVIPTVERGALLAFAGMELKCLGRLDEAPAPQRAAQVLAESSERWVNAVSATGNLVETYLASGHVEDAWVAAQQGVHCATRSRSDYALLASDASAGAVLHARGILPRAKIAFERAEGVQPRIEPDHPLLYSLQGFYYNRFLYDAGLHSELRPRAFHARQYARKHAVLLDMGLGELYYGIALTLSGQTHRRVPGAISPYRLPRRAMRQAESAFATALQWLRQAQDLTLLPSGLLPRASFHRDFGDRGQAERDLKEALELSARFVLRLHETDARLLQGHLVLDEKPPNIDTAEAALARAQELVKQTGYQLRDADLLILEGRLLSKKGEKEPGRAKLEEAIAVARREEKHGCVYQLAVDQADRYLAELN